MAMERLNPSIYYWCNITKQKTTVVQRKIQGKKKDTVQLVVPLNLRITALRLLINIIWSLHLMFPVDTIVSRLPDYLNKQPLVCRFSVGRRQQLPWLTYVTLTSWISYDTELSLISSLHVWFSFVNHLHTCYVFLMVSSQRQNRDRKIIWWLSSLSLSHSPSLFI